MHVRLSSPRFLTPINGCIVTNPFPGDPRALHKTRSEGSRYLPHPPRFLTELPSEITVQSNEKLVLSVDVSALPTAEIKWNVNGFEVRPSKSVTLLNEQNRSTLVLNPPIKQGKYNVTAMNDIGKDTLMTKIFAVITETVEEIHSEITIGPRAAPDIVESAVTVTSAGEEDWEVVDDVSQNSSTSFETVLKQVDVPPQAAQKEEEVRAAPDIIESAVTVQAEEKQEEVKLEKQVEEVPKPIQEQTVVKVAYVKTASKVTEEMPRKPTVRQQPIQHIHVSTGERLILESFVDSSPPSTFQWYVNNFEVKRGEFIIIEQPTDNHSRAIFLKPVPGQYKVVATNLYGQIETVTRVTTEIVHEEFQETTTVTSNIKPVMFRLKKKNVVEKSNLPKAPVITERLPPTIKIPEGHCLSLKCAVDAIPKAVFTWLINNFELKPSNNVQIASSGPNLSEVQLQNAGPGKYEVIARNSMGQDSSSCKVIVEYVDAGPRVIPPKFSQDLPQETITTTGENRFIVTVSGLPPFNFSWFLNEEDVSRFMMVEENRSVLTLPSPPVEGSVVSIVVNNSHGTIKSESIIKRQPEIPAKSRGPAIIKCLEDLEITQGDSLVWGIAVDREASPCTFEWILEHEKLEPARDTIIESNGYESLLSITPVTSGGQMTVVVTNRHGTAASTAFLSVAGLYSNLFFFGLQPLLSILSWFLFISSLCMLKALT